MCLRDFANLPTRHSPKRCALEYKGLIDDKVFALVCVGIHKIDRIPPARRKYYDENKG